MKINRKILFPVAGIVLVGLLLCVVWGGDGRKRSHLPEAEVFMRLGSDSLKKLVASIGNMHELTKDERADYDLIASLLVDDNMQADSMLNAVTGYYTHIRDTQRLGHTYFHAALRAERENNYLLAVAHYLRSLEIYRKESRYWAFSHQCLGFLYSALEMHDESLHHFRQAYQAYKNDGDEGRACFNAMFGVEEFLYLTPPATDSVLHYAPHLREEMLACNSPFTNTPYYIMCRAHLLTGRVEEALKYNDLSIEERGHASRRDLRNRVEIFYRLERYTEALALLDTLEVSDTLRQSEHWLWRSRIYEKQGHLREALPQRLQRAALPLRHGCRPALPYLPDAFRILPALARRIRLPAHLPLRLQPRFQQRRDLHYRGRDGSAHRQRIGCPERLERPAQEAPGCRPL